MKKLILILTILAFGFGCKKGEKCLVGGKWYHVRSVWNGNTTAENADVWIEFNSDGYIYTSQGYKYKYVATDTKVNLASYNCNGKKLKLQHGWEYQGDVHFLDFDKNYVEYKR